MLPFGETVLLWRLERGWTQAELARRARLPRPNLSDVERGRREVTLRTLRALADAFGVRPGVLADGRPPPGAGEPLHLSRPALERVAVAAARGGALRDPEERRLAERLRLLLPRPPKDRRPSLRTLGRAWLAASARISPETRRSLVDRAMEKAGL